jgi:alkanesulfonate monooxygenase SsuD/methylene tetrahydromethanopterin reductase-like flavin-dependent oxidoreductase (luciferase family)
MNETIKFGIHLPLQNFGESTGFSREEILALALKIERLGYDSIIVCDCGIKSNAIDDSIDILSDIAAITSRIKLGSSMLNIIERHPIVCTKALSSIDVLSKGRLFAAGVSPGIDGRNYDGCTISIEERQKRFIEALQIMNLIWNNKNDDHVVQGQVKSSLSLANFDGTYYRTKWLYNEPIPFQKPHPPIYISTLGSSFDQLNIVAKYGNGWMIRGHEITPDKFREMAYD